MDLTPFSGLIPLANALEDLARMVENRSPEWAAERAVEIGNSVHAIMLGGILELVAVVGESRDPRWGEYELIADFIPEPVPESVCRAAEFDDVLRLVEEHQAVLDPDLIIAQKKTISEKLRQFACRLRISRAYWRKRDSTRPWAVDSPRARSASAAGLSSQCRQRSAPMLKSELVKRLEGSHGKGSRPRKYEAFFTRHKIQKIDGAYLWTLCLDDMDKATRKRLS